MNISNLLEKCLRSEAFKKYYSFLVECNKNMNLTSIVDRRGVYIKHFLDSAFVNELIGLYGKVIDVGSGAGFPGVPLKLFNPQLDVTLLDSSKKKIKFLEELSSILETNFNLLDCRSEDLCRDLNFRERFDFCVSRAVASLDILSEICLPLVKPGGSFLSLKGPSIAHELKISKPLIDKLGGKIIKIHNFELPENLGVRCVVEVKKIAKTPKKYPRIFSQIKKLSDNMKKKIT